MTLGAAVERSASSPPLSNTLGAVMAFGCNDDGQLGTGERRRLSIAIDTVTASNLPARIGVLHELDIAAISCGSRHTMVLTTAGEVYSFGWGSVRLSSVAQYQRVAAANSVRLCLQMGQLGHGDLKSSGVPKRIEFFAENGLVVDYISCGGCHSAAVTRDGTEAVHTWRTFRFASAACVF